MMTQVDNLNMIEKLKVIFEDLLMLKESVRRGKLTLRLIEKRQKINYR